MRWIAALFLALASPSLLRGQEAPWIELGLGTGREPDECLGCGSPIRTYLSARAAVGVHISPRVAVGLSQDVGGQLTFDGPGAEYIVTSGFAELNALRFPAGKLRLGLGRMSSETGRNESGVGPAARVGVALQLPPGGIASALLTADYIMGFASYYRSANQSRPFDPRVLQFALSLRIGGRYQPAK